MPKGGRRPGAGRPKIIEVEMEVYLCVEHHISRLYSFYEKLHHDATVNRWARGAPQLLGGEDGESSLHDALSKPPRSSRMIISDAHDAPKKDDLSNPRSVDPDNPQPTDPDTAAGIFDEAVSHALIDEDRANSVHEGWIFLRTKGKGRQSPKWHVVKGPTGEPIEVYPPKLLAAALKAAAKDLGYSPSRAREIWIKWKWRMHQDKRGSLPDVQ